ncbi:MAG: hypothetical protein ISS71_01745 [Phycisphaerae bacterium]|nr:hypothetical protein [Phycisphaerae bacterium]
MKRIIMYSLLVLSLISSLRADRLMDPNETETLVRHLTNNPRMGWIPQGMIQARHMEYYGYDNSLKEATETIYRDNSRFRLEMHLEDGLSIDSPSNQNIARQFQQDFKLNRNRIFVWDGQKYVQYYQSADYAVVVTDSQNVPTDTCGPISAGIIPWGHGDFTFWVIMSQDPTASVISQSNHDTILFEYISDTISPEAHISFVLDPSKDYAVLSYSIENDQALLQQTYEEYIQAGNQWVPSKVLIERFDKRSGTPQLLSYEDWQFETIDSAMPSDDVFSVNFKDGTMVELKPGGNLKTFLYNASDSVDISEILEDKISMLQTQDPDSVNCATAAIQHIMKRFSKTISPSELASLVSGETKTTALSDIKETFEDAGLTCMAIETDLQTLEKIPDCTKILHLALSNHYVILDHIDQDSIWVIDLTNRKFYAKRKIDEFLQEWNNGAALLISNEPITPPLDASFRYLQAEEISQIHGGDFGTYSCTDMIQGNYHILCPQPTGGFLCYGAYYIFYERYGCIEDENGGTCTGQKMPCYDYYHCLNDPFRPGNCILPNPPITRYIRACQ